MIHVLRGIQIRKHVNLNLRQNNNPLRVSDYVSILA